MKLFLRPALEETAVRPGRGKPPCGGAFPSPRFCYFVSGIGCLQKTLCLSSLWPFGVTFTFIQISILFLIIKGLK